MSRTDTEIKKVKGVESNYLAQYAKDDHSLDAMDEYRTLPRHKMIQATSAQKLIAEFGIGTIILQPGNVVVWRYGDDPFPFIPFLFFVEWLKWCDLRDENSVIGRTMDPTHEYAKKARDSEQRLEIYDGHEERSEKERWHYRYVQAFRFVGVIFDVNHPLHLTPLTLSFERGEFATGQNLINAVKMRKMLVNLFDDDGNQLLDEDGNKLVDRIPVPLFAQMWKVDASLRERGADRKWWGLDVKQMEELVPADIIEEMEALHKDYKKAKDAERLIVDEGSQKDDNDPAAVAASKPGF